MNSLAPQAFYLSDEWRRWVGENVLLGVGEQTIVDTLAGQGMSPEQARAELETARADPYLDAGDGAGPHMITTDGQEARSAKASAGSGLGRHHGVPWDADPGAGHRDANQAARTSVSPAAPCCVIKMFLAHSISGGHRVPFRSSSISSRTCAAE